MAALRQRASLVRQVDAGLRATAGRQPVQGQQQVGQQAHKWATSGECCKAGPVLVPEDLVPALLAVLVGREGKQHQDGQHLAAGELAPLLPWRPEGAGGPRPTGLARQPDSRAGQGRSDMRGSSPCQMDTQYGFRRIRGGPSGRLERQRLVVLNEGGGHQDDELRLVSRRARSTK